jgi:hypothetical protein
MSGRAGGRLLARGVALLRSSPADQHGARSAARGAVGSSREDQEGHQQQQPQQQYPLGIGRRTMIGAFQSTATPTLPLTAHQRRRRSVGGICSASSTSSSVMGLAASAYLRQQHQHQRMGLTTSAAPYSSSSTNGANAPTTPTTTPTPTPPSLADVQCLLDSLSAMRLREELAAASDATPYVPFARLLEIVRETGAADTAAEAERVADALVRAGVVLRLGGVVYLRPLEVAEMVLSSVPSDGAAATTRLREIEAELDALDRAHADIVAQARRWPRFWLGAGCAAFAAQLAGFIYLCYWELSWDVVEPIACFVSMGWTLVAWLYFLARGSAFDFDAFDSHWTQAGLERRMAARGFDPERHEQLAMARDRYRRYLAAQRSAALAEGVPAGGVVSGSRSEAAAPSSGSAASAA